MPSTGIAYWLKPLSGSSSSAVRTDPSSSRWSRRPTPFVPTPKTSSVLTPDGIAGPKRCPSGTAAFSARPPATAGPTGAPVASTPGCWASAMLKKSPFTPPTAPRPSAMCDSRSRAATEPGCSRSTETRRSRRSTVSRCPYVAPCEPRTENPRYVTPGPTEEAGASTSGVTSSAPARAVPPPNSESDVTSTVSTARTRCPRLPTVTPEVPSTLSWRMGLIHARKTGRESTGVGPGNSWPAPVKWPAGPRYSQTTACAARPYSLTEPPGGTPMSRTRRAVVAGLAAALAGSLAAPARAASRGRAGAAPVGGPPLRHAHAHNDYAHPHPLDDALSHGFTSVEADIWLVGDKLLVGHDASGLDPARTLEALYLDPLLRRVRAQHGRVYDGYDLSLQLLVDIKSAGESTYRALARHLRPYRAILSAYVDGQVRRGAVTAVVSGDRGARGPMAAERVRHAFYDGRLSDLGGAPASFAPLVSDNWSQNFTWQGVGPMPARERAALRRIVTAAHAEHRKVRFWGTPDRPGAARDALWRELLAAGVDYLNTDDLAGLEAFLRAAG